MSRRRGNLEGSIRQRRKGLWEGRLRIEGRRISVYASTRVGASEALAEKRAAAAQGGVVHESASSLGAYLEDWLALQRSRLRPRSFAERQRYVEKLTLHLGSLKLRNLKPRRIERLYVDLEAAGLGLRSRATLHSTLYTALQHAVATGELVRNPAALVAAPRYVAPAVTKWNEDEVKRLLAVTDTTPHAALGRYLLTGGPRIGEALAACWGDIDWKAGTLTIERQQQELPARAEPDPRKRLRHDAPLKSPASYRTLELPAETLAALRRLRQARYQGAVPLPGALAFVGSRAGRPLRRGPLVRDWWHPLLDRAGLARVGFHVARHSHATLLLSQGQNPAAVARRLGHTRTMLLKTYAGALPSDDARMVAAIEEALR